MGKPSAPTPPNPTQVAQAQTASNRETAVTQAGLNMVNQTGPGGSVGYEQIGKWKDGTPRFQQTTSLSPESQAIYDAGIGTQTNLANLAQEQSGRLGELLNEPLDWSAQQDYLNELTAGNLDPAWARMEEGERQRLANQGIAQGSTAFTRAMDDFRRSQSSAYNDANLNNFTTALQSQLALRQAPINEIIGLSSGTQVGMPQFSAGVPQTGVAGTDVAGIQQNAFNQQMAGYNAQQQQMGGMFGALGSLAGTALPFILSDERMKEDIERVGETDGGSPLYRYKYKGDDSGATHIGVLAQEEAKKNPGAVVRMGSVLGVDYGKVT